jgi:hypothetical protein
MFQKGKSLLSGEGVSASPDRLGAGLRKTGR